MKNKMVMRFTISALCTVLTGFFLIGCMSTKYYPDTIIVKPKQTIIADSEFFLKERKRIIIPHGVTKIGKRAFVKNKAFRVIIPETCTEISPDAFDKNVILIYMRDMPGEYIGDYKINNNGNGIIITNYIGSNMNVVIPNEINGYTVTEIGRFAFAGKGLTSVIIPDTVNVIQECAFEYNFLQNIIIPEGITKLSNCIFHYNELNSVTLPNTLSVIGESAFQNNKLKTITFPESVVTINKYAFCNNHLETLNLPSNLTSIDSGAFWDNNIPAPVFIPDSVTTMGERVFERYFFSFELTGNKKFATCTFNYYVTRDKSGRTVYNIYRIDDIELNLWSAYAPLVPSPYSEESCKLYLGPGKHSFILGYSDGFGTYNNIPIEYEFIPGKTYKLDIEYKVIYLIVRINGSEVKKFIVH